MTAVILPMVLSLMCATVAQAQDLDEVSAIMKTAMDYMESWYQGDAKKMKESLHKQLAKRSLKGYLGEPALRHTTASDMIRYTTNGYGKTLWEKGQKIEIVVLDFYKNIASVKVIAPHYYEYLHLAKIDSKWVILNALYESKSPLDDGDVKK